MQEVLIVKIANTKNLPLSRARSLPFLTEEDKKRAEKFSFEEDEVLSLVSSYFKRRYVGEWTIGEKGKPLANNKFFNLSHTAGVVVFVEADSDVGIDVERPRSINEKLLSYIADEEEKEFIQSERNFFEVWTAKESLSKAHGGGVARPKKIPALPLSGEKEYLGEKYYSRSAQFGEYYLSVTRKGETPFEIQIVLENF